MSGSELVVENFNLGMILLYSCSLTLLTDFVADPEIQAEFGKLICLLVLIIIGVNLLFVIVSMCKDLARKLKKKVKKQKVQQKKVSFAPQVFETNKKI